VDRNTLHTKAIEEAAFDKNLYWSSQGSAHIDLRFPECVSLYFRSSGSVFNGAVGMKEEADAEQNL